MPQGAVSNGKHIDTFIPPHLRDMFYRHPTRPYAWNNGLDPYGFFTDGLAAYLPLWALRNSTFQSVDAYGHICTVTGALWQPNGRLFDHLDDRINIPHNAAFSFDKDDPFTIIATVKLDNDGTNDAIVAKLDLSTSFQGYQLLRDAGNKLEFALVNDNAGGNLISVETTNTVLKDVWRCVGVTYDGSEAAAGAILYLDGVAETPIVNTDNLSLTSINSVDLKIGERENDDVPFGGTIGEVWIYNRELPAGEMLRTSKTVMWRYQ